MPSSEIANCDDEVALLDSLLFLASRIWPPTPSHYAVESKSAYMRPSGFSVTRLRIYGAGAERLPIKTTIATELNGVTISGSLGK